MKFMHRFGAFWNELTSQRSEQKLKYFVWLLNHMPGRGIPKLGVSLVAQVQDDLRLVQRVMNSYKLAMHAFTPSASGWDTGLLEIKKEAHDALWGTSVNEAARVLRDPSANTLFWGFDAVASSPTGEVEPHELVLRRLNGSTDWKILYAMWVRDALIGFAEATGARRIAILRLR